MKRYIPLLAAFAMFPAAAAEVDIDVDSDTYYYGDHLAYTVTVSEVTGAPALLYIIDADGKKSSAIPLAVSELVTAHRSPFPFEAATYPEGGWTLEIRYGEFSDTTGFLLQDSGRAVIPTWIKDSGRIWVGGGGVQYYMTALSYMLEYGIIEAGAPSEPDGAPYIPEWVKTITAWWILGHIPDHTYAASIEYLVDQGIIRIGQQ